ncbi:MAG TPA: Crp/Fnr family transcriptional regulator [Brevundimonas sp.]|jgi:CRP-like cAMP-binding protein|uniref:Crp/Fnr family transcriptional regulator n=1 Tax=Brevundimonas sp. TaxID=1871086 RepID=UPI002E10DA91|nr:Crp/Fnr family transcriptional regulator [Brevundimonas sp.]
MSSGYTDNLPIRTPDFGNPTDALVRKFLRRDQVSAMERGALETLMEPPRRVSGGRVLTSLGERPDASTLLISGICVRMNVLRDGSRSITQLSLAGDFVDLHSLLIPQMDHAILTLTDCWVSRAPHARIRSLAERCPHLARLLWLETVIDGAIHRQWLHRMATQDALGRLAHLICETEARLAVVDLVEDDSFDFPLTQVDLADCLGLSTVHVNRTLMSLRRLQLVEWRAGRMRLLDRERLQQLAEFDPTYLRLDRAPV